MGRVLTEGGAFVMPFFLPWGVRRLGEGRKDEGGEGIRGEGVKGGRARGKRCNVV